MRGLPFRLAAFARYSRNSRRVATNEAPYRLYARSHDHRTSLAKKTKKNVWTYTRTPIFHIDIIFSAIAHTTKLLSRLKTDYRTKCSEHARRIQTSYAASCK